MTAKDYMQTWVDQHQAESAGPNRSPLIDQMEHWIGIPLGESYCATALSYAFHLAKDEPGEQFPRSASSQKIRREFEARKLLSTNPDDLKTWKGALGGWTDPDGVHGHIFLIKGRLTGPDGSVVGVETLEANTSPGGHTNNGTGFFERQRTMDELGWILDCSGFAGGAWWN